jgi:hypothetical protein
MLLQVNNFECKSETVRSYWLPKRAFQELFCSHSPCDNFYSSNNNNLILIRNIIIINDVARHQDPILLFKIPMSTRKIFSEICRNLGTRSLIGLPTLF